MTQQQLMFILIFSAAFLIHFSVVSKKASSSTVRQCQISVHHAKVIQIRPKIVKIQCHPGYSTSTGQDHVVIRCKKKLRKATLNFCHPKSRKYSHPYPLFQSDDPQIGMQRNSYESLTEK